MRGRFVVVRGQGRSGSTLIMRLLNSAPGVRISGENNRAFDHLAGVARCFANTRRDRDGSLHCIAWMAPPGVDRLSEGLRSLACSLYNPEGRFAIFGFKEIRYGRDYDGLERDMGFLRDLFPNLRVILNVRETDACARSAWWADDPEGSRKILDTVRGNFDRYFCGHPGECYWMPYEELRSGSPVLRGMFSFLGVCFRPEYERELETVLR